MNKVYKKSSKLLKNKYILDACCGNRMFWINKKHPNTLYIDIRKEKVGFCADRKNVDINPDLICDFRALPFSDNSFKHIVWDPPHIITKKGMKQLTGIMIKKYGALHADTWRDDLKRGFKELWRVLDLYGTLSFKFCDTSVDFKEVLNLFPVEALYGITTTKKKNHETKFFIFIKMANDT